MKLLQKIDYYKNNQHKIEDLYCDIVPALIDMLLEAVELLKSDALKSRFEGKIKYQHEEFLQKIGAYDAQK